MTPPAATLEYAFRYAVHATCPLEPTEGSPHPTRQVWQLSEATLEGERIHATLANVGLDWMEMSDDGHWRPDCRLHFRADNGAIILLHYTGLVEQTEAFMAAAEADRPTDWSDQYLRMQMRFETGDPELAWLNTSLFIAKGRLLGRGRMEYAVFRVA